MKKLLLYLSICALAAVVFGQSLTSVSGVVTDPSGAVVPGAKLTLLNVDNDAQRDDVTDAQGRYIFPQIQPGRYRITAKAQGFTDVVVNDVRLLVNTPATINISFEKVGTTTTTIQVEAQSVQVNTTDASIGNAIAGQAITQLPFEARNVVGLLALQPGVVFLGEPDPGALNDFRSGAVNGGKSDQANVTLDGVDVNDQQNRSAFTSVLRVTLDSVQEFRTTTSNSGAEMGRTSGAQVALVTKSGTNTVHGSAYEFLRNTLTSANSFFNNSAGVPKQKLNRNVYGVSVGGPIKKDRLFYFLNWEGRQDKSEGSALRMVPNSTLRQGIFTYVKTDNSIATLSADDVKALDPLHIGIDPDVLKYYQQYPQPNDNTVGDGLNIAGYRFNAATPLRWNTYTAKFDYGVDAAGKHRIFWRGNLQNDNFINGATGIPQFPGQPASSVFLDNSKGYAVGYTAIVTNNLVSTFHYGYTRQGTETTGVQNAPAAYFRDMSSLYSQSRGTARITPLHELSEEASWNKGAHTISFGGVVRFISNSRASTSSSFSQAYGNSSWLAGTGATLQVAGSKASTPYRRQMSNLLGLLTELDHQINYDLQGNTLAEGLPIQRSFAQQEYEMYVQDTWKATRGLTVTAGVRYTLAPPVYERNGYQTSANIPLGKWFDARGALAEQGKSQLDAGRISFDLASKPNGRDLYPYHKKDFAPRLGIAYSPQGSSGLSKFLFGGPGSTSIRAGWGMYYDAFGQGLIRDVDARMLGFSSRLTNPATASPLTTPRFTSYFSVPLDKFVPAPKGGFPQTYPDVFAITQGVDDTLKSPYTMNMNFSIGREFKGGFFVQGSYVGHLARRSLISDDLAMPTNLKDPKSGMTYFDAAKLLSNYTFANTPASQVPKIPFWENMWPGAAGKGLTATQAIYQHYLATGGDFTTALSEIDGEASLDGTCDPACSVLGPYAIFSSQYGSLLGLRSRGGGNYHAMQWTVRKRFSQGYQFDFNYTWSKSIDLGSSREIDGSFTNASGSSTIINAWFPGQMKAVSDYDTTHQFSALAVVELPFGKGKKFLANANSFVDGVVGGWQLSAVFRNTSGFPVGVGDGVGWPTNWEYTGFATQTGIVPAPQQSKNAPSAQKGAKGGPNIFADPATAFAAYSFTAAGETGQRNGVRGDGVFGIDMGLGKRFHLFTFRDQPHTLQFRAEGFNITNTVRFDVRSAGLSAANQAKFGQYTDVLSKPRVFQFSARYEF
jgi:hypothetical protein